MKILKVIKGDYELIYTDAKPKEAGVYRRYAKSEWEHLIDRNGGTWLKIYDFTFLEKAYEEWVRGQRKHD